MNAKRRPKAALVAGRPLATVTESVLELRCQIAAVTP